MRHSRRAFALTLVLALVAVVAPAAAQSTYEVTITNITQNQILSPPLVVAHNDDIALFRVGEAAIPELAELAEDGSPAALKGLLDSLPSVQSTAAAGGPVMPGESVTIEIEAGFPFNRISAVGMLITTNDAFFALNGAPRPPARNGFSSHRVPAYDSGSEANTESCDHIPGPPCGNGGVRVTAGSEGFVYIHSGIQGVGDVTPENDWRNPVAQITIQSR